MHRLWNASLREIPIALLALLAGSAWVSASPSISPSPAVTHPAGTFNVSGTGFGVTEAVDLYFDTTDEQLAVTDASGNFPNIPMPVSAAQVPGTHWVTAIGRHSGLAAQHVFTVRTDWSQFRFGATKRSFNPYENVLDPDNVNQLDLAWSITTGSQILSSPTVFAGNVYVGSQDGKLYAVNATTGATLWTATTGGSIGLSSPAAAKGIVYVGSDDAKLYAFSSSTGAPVSGWPVTTGGPVESSPVVANNVVYVGSNDHKLYGFNASNGASLPGWPVTTGGSVQSSPAVANGVVYVGSSDAKLYAFDAVTGAALWTVTTGASILSSPTVWHGRVYVGSTDGKLYAIKAATGATLWTAAIGSSIQSSPAVSMARDGYTTLIFGTVDGYMEQVDALTGDMFLAPTLGAGVYSSPAIANGVVFVGCHDYSLYALDATDLFNTLWYSIDAKDHIGSSPAVANGMVYVGSNDHRLFAYALNAGGNSVYRNDRKAPVVSSLHPDLRLSPWKTDSSPQPTQ
ncbi:MAG TPA: PQQ-binding-like beta-propeller repeat protein [Rhizomicrobium sp.]|jgi:outer membrane protein assembly factor BamB